MNSKKSIDTFQITGFSLSVIVSIGLIFMGQNTLNSTILGCVLAIFTQLLDLQLRISKTEKKIIEQGDLSKILYSDDELLQNLQEISDYYDTVQKLQFSLFQQRAKDSVSECRDTLRKLSEGRLEVSVRSKYSFGVEAIKSAKKRLIHSAALKDLSYWEGTYPEKALIASKIAIERGVAFTRIYIYTLKDLQPYISVLKKQQDAGINVLIANPDEIPVSLIQDLFLMDDTAFSIMHPSVNGGVRAQYISINKTEVADTIKNIESLFLYAKELDIVFSEKEKEGGSV